ncbi:MAG: hypothetical protein ACTSYB_03685 [Candidatus Helarchaeota archaeon]
MSYKRPKLTDKKKLCPRCGSPMMSKSETVKYCPVCHFSETTTKTTIKIKMEEETKEEKVPDLEVYRVSAGGITKATRLESDSAFIIVDRKANILWMWKGEKCSPGDAYKAGVQTTKLKSSLRMYSASIKQIEEGDEPDNFPLTGEKLEAIEEEERRRKEEEERKRREEEERKQREEAERKQREEAERKQREEAERKRKEEEERKQRKEEAKLAEKEDSTDVWKKVAEDTKTGEEIKESSISEEDTELSQAISSLTLVRGINEEIAKKLYNANITSIMGLSLSNPEVLAEKAGLELSLIEELIGNAKDLLGLD